MAKLLKHFGFGGKKYNASTNQHTDYSGSTLKSNSVNELVTKNNTKSCSNNYLNGASAATSRKGPSNSKSDYDTRSLKLRNDESTKKSKPSSTEKFKGFGKSSKESYQQSSKTLKAHLKSKESDSKSKHKNITFSNLITSADHHAVMEPPDINPQVPSTFVPEILEEYSNPLDLTMENDPLTIDDDYSTPYDQVDKFFADGSKNVTDNATGNLKMQKNAVNSRVVSRVISVKPNTSQHATETIENEKKEKNNVECVSTNHNTPEKIICENNENQNNENIKEETKASDENGARGETNQSYCTSGGSVTVVANRNFDDMQPIIVLNQDTLSTSICCHDNQSPPQKPPSTSQADEKVDCLLRNNCNHASIRPKSDGVLVMSSKKSTSKNQSKLNHRNNIKLKNEKIFNTSNIERKKIVTNDGVPNCTPTKHDNKEKKEEAGGNREHTRGDEDDEKWVGVLLKNQDWYHGCISRLEAEQLLSSQSTGTYLVRVSESNKKDFSLSLKSKSGFLHIKIVQDSNSGDYILGQFSQPFLHVSGMVDYYTTNQLPIKGNDGLTLSYPLMSKEHKIV